MIYSIDLLYEKVNRLDDSHVHNKEEQLRAILELISTINIALQWRTELPSFSRIKLERTCHKISSWLLSNLYNYSEAYIIREKLAKTLVLLKSPSKYNPFIWGSLQ